MITLDHGRREEEGEREGGKERGKERGIHLHLLKVVYLIEGIPNLVSQEHCRDGFTIKKKNLVI